MPLSEDEEREERRLKLDQMAVNIEKMRADMAAQRDRLAMETRSENRKYAVSITLAASALVGASLAIGNYFGRQTPSVTVAPPQVVFQPGSIVVQQPAAQK